MHALADLPPVSIDVLSQHAIVRDMERTGVT